MDSARAAELSKKLELSILEELELDPEPLLACDYCGKTLAKGENDAVQNYDGAWCRDHSRSFDRLRPCRSCREKKKEVTCFGTDDEGYLVRDRIACTVKEWLCYDCYYSNPEDDNPPIADVDVDRLRDSLKSSIAHIEECLSKK